MNIKPVDLARFEIVIEDGELMFWRPDGDAYPLGTSVSVLGALLKAAEYLADADCVPELDPDEYERIIPRNGGAS